MNPHDPFGVGSHRIEIAANTGWDDDPSFQIVCECHWECWNQPTLEAAFEQHRQHVADAAAHDQNHQPVEGTPDDPAVCAICGHETSIAMIAVHLEREHGIDTSGIADAPTLDRTEGSDDDDD